MYNPCDEKRMRSGADYDAGHDFRDTEQETYGRRRGRRYIGHTVSVATLYYSCGRNSPSHYF